MTNWPNTIQCLGSDDIMPLGIKSSDFLKVEHPFSWKFDMSSNSGYVGETLSQECGPIFFDMSSASGYMGAKYVQEFGPIFLGMTHKWIWIWIYRCDPKPGPTQARFEISGNLEIQKFGIPWNPCDKDFRILDLLEPLRQRFQNFGPTGTLASKISRFPNHSGNTFHLRYYQGFRFRYCK